jgi:cytochrome c biogenesis protein CcmG, thiol:disulfide interchange protein DsbE
MGHHHDVSIRKVAMLHAKTLLAAAAAALCLTAAIPAQANQPGKPAPDFSLPGTGGPVRLADLRGQLVYVDFWASWCAPCKQSFPFLNEMQDKYGARGFTVVGINVDIRRADADRFLAGTPARFPIAFDDKGETPKAYAVRGMPSSYLVAPDGRVLSAHVGFKEEDKKALEDKIRQALPR